LEPSVEQVFDEDVPADVVISWSVPGDPTLTAGALVEPMTPVQLVVSMGPQPRTVPSLVGRTADEVRAELEGLRLVYVEEGQEFSDDVPLGSVIRQSPEPGVEVARDTPVGVVVSLGPDLVTFPDLSAAATFEQAAALLTDSGFVPQLVFGDAQGAVRSYTIDGRQPGPGETFRRGTTVQLEAL
jgi:serine/threonine-protein kinase